MRTIKISAIFMLLLLLATSGHGQTPTTGRQQGRAQINSSQAHLNENIQVTPAGATTGGGTSGRLSKWVGVSGASTYVLGDSNVFEDKFGKVGVGTTTPTSLLTVAGMIETTLGGVKFPDGTVQTTAFNPNQVVRSLNGLQGDLFIAAGTNITVTPSGGNTLTIAAPNALTAIAHNATLSGNGTGASPLSIADGGVGTAQLANNAVTAAKIAPGNVVKSLNGLKDDVVLTAGSNITLTPNGNTLTIASTAADPAQTVFQRSFEISVPQDDNVTHTLLLPAGKRLIIEYISIDVFGDGDPGRSRPGQ